MKEPVYILDGYSLIFRSHFAMIGKHLTNSQGRTTSAVFGFFRTLFSLFNKYTPKYFAVIMDSKTPTFRHQIYREYKANRDNPPEELRFQIPLVEELLDALGIRWIRKDGYEADDIMATLVEQCRRDGRPCYLITGDKDLFQLVGGMVKILRLRKSDYTQMDGETLKEDLGIEPEQIVDYLALIGDQSDNIPGVKGIGPKTARELLEKYKTLDGIYSNIDRCPPGQRKKLLEGREDAYLSRELATLKKDLSLGTGEDIESFRVEKLNIEAAIPLFLRENMKSIADVLGANIEQKEAVLGTEEKRGKYVAVTSLDELDRWMNRVRNSRFFAFDVETDSIDSISATPVGFSFCIKSGEACYIPLLAQGKKYFSEEEIKRRFKELFSERSLRFIGQNLKYDYKVLNRWGIKVINIHFDTMVAGWLLDSQFGSYGLNTLAEKYLRYRPIHFDEVVEKGANFTSVPLENAVQYAAEDADITFRLYELFKRLLEQRGLTELFFNVEMQLVKVLADMELRGISVKKEVLDEYSSELTAQMKEIEEEVFRKCGEQFNINSTKQLQEILFTKRKLNPVRKIKTGYSTDNTVLEELAKEDPVPALVLRHRFLAKLKSTYVDALPQLINPSTGKLHTHFIQTGTATGRLSSREPNLQNIPIKTDEGRRIRQAFVPSPGCVFLSADYSQIELVILAHLSGDPVLMEAFKSGKDVHRQTSALIFEMPEEEITSEQRRIAKIINFGIMYGMSAFRLSRELGISRKEGENFIKEYFRKYSKVREFIEETIKEAEKEGSVRTILGRQRPVPRINSKNKAEKMAAERIAVNTPIQGSAADIVKLAMIKIDRRLERDGLKTAPILQVHDELIFEVLEEEVESAKEIIREEMESAVSLSIPLKVEIEIGNSWGEMH